MITKTCRICGNRLQIPILDLGFHPPSDHFLTQDDLQLPETYYPLELYYCHDCDFFQLGYTVPPEELYRSNYPYRTGDNTAGVEHFMELASEIIDKYIMDENSHFHIDIGGNDGTLCEHIRPHTKTFNIDPSGVDERAIKEHFDYRIAKGMVNSHGKADVITATNVLAHVHNLTDFLKGVKHLLCQDGTFIVEVPDALQLINKCAYDTIYHEHLSYFTVNSMHRLMLQNGFYIQTAEDIPIHGGSIRYYIRHNDHEKKHYPMTKISQDSLNQFRESVERNRSELYHLLFKLHRSGKRIIGLSAPAKGNTILNYCNIGRFIDFMYEVKDSPKIGLYTPGQHIPVLDDRGLETVSGYTYDYGIIFAWNWAEQIIERSRQMGFKGDFVLPIPVPKFIDSTDNLLKPSKAFEGYYYGHKEI